MNRTLGMVAMTASLAATSMALAAEPSKEGWEWTLAPYIMGASMDGTLAVRGNEADVDLSASEIFDHMDFGFMTMAAAHKGKWGFGGDLIWVDLSADPPVGDVESRLTIVTLDGMRRVSPWAEVTFGARWTHVRGHIEPAAAPGMVLERSRDWIDPVVGLILRTPGQSRWHGNLIADVGGFGVSSDLTWQVFPTVGYDVATWASIEAGWRFLDTDYETGSGVDRFAWDMMISGPVVGASFRF
jgi:hypothetical protein